MDDAAPTPRRSARTGSHRPEEGPRAKRRRLIVSPAKDQQEQRPRARQAAPPGVRPGSTVFARHRHSEGRYATPQAGGRHTARHSAALSPPPSPARALLRQAQAVAELDTDWLGRRPFIMDVILNAKPPVSEYSEDIVMEALERSQAALPRQQYQFDDHEGVEQYWADQAVLWRGVAVGRGHRPLDKGYRVSAERSTASWPVDAEDDSSRSSQSDAEPWSISSNSSGC
ncbi:hypothetical protein WOLCODRAFT_162603 [Wolfiporia cocos MD-104 SS10]|uniref:Uncharacterized protein n=1 Tax=Wolfiporia cocos (strain MD-104) TaxID=742152 RepID=A0A2H3JSU6_WOLCO|nr:hypothetical protein WOLCODRAFT_162603 [Wolfiporia cocos MD-104 SS10]